MGKTLIHLRCGDPMSGFIPGEDDMKKWAALYEEALTRCGLDWVVVYTPYCVQAEIIHPTDGA